MMNDDVGSCDELFYLKENTGEGRFIFGPAQQRFWKCQVLFGIK